MTDDRPLTDASALTGLKADLHRYLQQGRDSLVRTLDGLGEYDSRRPLTPSGTNLLGLVKHLAGVELGYLGDSAGRPAPVTLPWEADGSVWQSADMWAMLRGGSGTLLTYSEQRTRSAEGPALRFLWTAGRGVGGVPYVGRMFESGAHPQLTVAEVPALVGGLAALDLGELTDARRVELISVLESLKGAAAGVQARLAVDFAESQEAAQSPQHRSVAAQVALARRESPHRGSRHLGFAQAMVREMPHTMGHLAAGRVSEWRATIVCRETACLTVADRAAVDAALAADLPTLGDRQVQSRARALAARLDATAMAKRAARAQGDRHVSLRPAPDTMTYLTALLPVAQGVAVFAALERAATTERATTAERAGHDDRGRGQLMADSLVERVTGQTTAAAVPIEVVMLMSGDTLAGVDDTPAELPGYGPVPGETARAILAASSETEAAIWFRRALTASDGMRLVGLDSRRRLFPEALKRFLILRDKSCRTPWCDAPIRHADHVLPARRGGPTTAANGQGLCEACNQVKEAAGWCARVVEDGTRDGARHRVRLRTPTGATYDSTAPPLLEGAPGLDTSWLEHHLHLQLGAA